LEGQVVAQGQPDWDALHKLVVASFPNNRQFTRCTGPYSVWRIRAEDLVFQATSPSSPDGYSSAGFFWFDLHAAPISETAFFTGHRSFYQSTGLVSVPGISPFVVEAKMGGPLTKPLVLDFGLYAYLPVLIRYAGIDGGLIQNPYDVPNFACGPRPPNYTRADVLDALNGSNPLLQLQALTWLAGSHSNLSADIQDIYHERIEDSVRFWAVSNDTSVSQAAATLASSEVDWVSRAAKFYVSVSKPQSVPSSVLTPRLKDLEITDLRIGSGGDFDDPDRAVKAGDRVVVEYEIKASTGAVLFSNLNCTDAPPVLEAGSNQVIEGLSKGVLGMKVGGLRMLEVPARMAYGDAGADVIPPGADLSIKLKLLHIATEPPFGMGSEKVLRIKEVLPGRGVSVPPGATVNVKCKVFRLDGREMAIPEFTGSHQMALATGSIIKNALIGMKPGGLRRLLVNFPSEFGQTQIWFHYGAQVLEVKLQSVVARR
jgi:FKBP-type peptidyl-prolyl cis-trans isomerase